MKFKKGDRVIFVRPESDNTIYVVEKVRASDGYLRFKGRTSAGWFSPENFMSAAIVESPLWRALE